MNDSSTPVVTRFAPSPTGFLHIGGARTALYNWLYARHHGGRFHLRVEDTDQARSTDAATQAILDGMTWLGLDWDGDSISQASRADRHRAVAEELLAAGMAYRCYASREELDAAREAAKAEGRRFLGDLWRDRDPADAPEGVTPVIRMAMPRDGETRVEDRVQGAVTVANSELEDLVILRSDGSPTYMLSVVVDDHDMGVTHVIRGDDHLNNTFRQVQIFHALGWPEPAFAHIPLIHGPDGKKLSKRHGALGVEAYREMGYLPEAMNNYLLRLGWSHGDAEIISQDQAIAWFDLDAIGKGAARFDFDKLDYLNRHYMRSRSPDSLVTALVPFLVDVIGRQPSDTEKERIIAAMADLTDRARRLTDLAESAALFCDIRPLDLTDKAAGMVNKAGSTPLHAARDALAEDPDWTAATVKDALMEAAAAQNLKPGKLMPPVRMAVTGGRPSGDLAETLAILGRDETLGRLDDQLERLKSTA
ncbi:glutamate--tRNA ligase [Yunchengibacter salinarum]|uniref:glutamate--tRNA ligase n=1 Tax=Yunchengibacter salinarum TaxID=3133399 RepID=UPI0035B5D32B